MARALQCPACGNRRSLSTLPNAPTFPCERCGRTLKIPAQLRSASARPGAGAGTATMPVPPPSPPSASPSPVRRRVAEPGPSKVAWPLQVLAWLIAFPLGLVAVVLPARAFGFLSSERLLDVLVGTGWGRYWRVLLIAPAWAVVTTVFVQLILVGFRKLGERRQTIRSERGGGDAPEPAAAASRSRGSRSRGRGAGRRRGRGRRSR